MGGELPASLDFSSFSNLLLGNKFGENGTNFFFVRERSYKSGKYLPLFTYFCHFFPQLWYFMEKYLLAKRGKG